MGSDIAPQCRSFRSISAACHAGEALRGRPLGYDAEWRDPTLDVRDVEGVAGPEYRRDVLEETGGRAEARPLELRDDGILGRRHVKRDSRNLERFSPVEIGRASCRARVTSASGPER